MIRMFFTSGWAAILTVGGTLGGVIVTQFVNAWNKRIDARTKREDRQQERASDLDKRVWQAKSDALKRVISGCRFVKWQAQWNEDDEIIRRAATMRALDQFRKRIGEEDGISEVWAFAAGPVCQALDEVLEQVNVLRRAHGDALVKLRRVGTQIDAVTQQPVTHDSGAELKRLEWSKQRQAIADAIGPTSDLNVDKVIALCDTVIDVARKDLRGDL